MQPPGPFHTALRLAIENRGLALNRICDRLAERGVRVSVSTLSNWQRGVSRPERPDSLRALSTVEEVLNLLPGTLCGLLEARPVTGRWRELGPGTSRLLADRLRSRLDADGPPALKTVSVVDDVTVGLPEDRWQASIRAVVHAEASGVSRHVVLFHTHTGGLPDVRAGLGCRLGRVIADNPAGLLAAELLFAPLMRGETYPLEYGYEGLDHGPYHGRWIHPGLHHPYELRVHFMPGFPVSAAHRIWRLDAHSPHKDVAELRLIGNEVAHLLDADPQPGFHGIRWE